MKLSKKLLYILCACASVAPCLAQTSVLDDTGDEYRIDTAEVNTIGLAIDALAFFQDNEFDGHVVRGYSLPGFRLQPRLRYTPLPQIRLEAGLHATVYDGAGKYPSYAFHDIAHWKGDQYQHGAHTLPFFRATASLGGPTEENPEGRKSRTTIVVGNIYGGATHGVILSLWNPELSLTDDPEMGTQIIVDRPRWHSDVWLNWQSYIFEEDTHQEAFTVGWTQHVALPKGFGIPVQLLVQHRGGEQDLKELNLGVQTLANAAVGVDYEWRPSSTSSSSPVVTDVKAEACGLFCYQQSGQLWPFDSGSALWMGASVEIKHDLNVKAGAFYASDNFCSLYGSPFFGTVSVKRIGCVFNKMATGYGSIDYGRTFCVNHRNFGGTYTLGAKVEGYLNMCGTMTVRRDVHVMKDGTVVMPDGRPVDTYAKAAHLRTPFTFGIYFRAQPSFVLKRLKK